MDYLIIVGLCLVGCVLAWILTTLSSKWFRKLGVKDARAAHSIEDQIETRVNRELEYIRDAIRAVHNATNERIDAELEPLRNRVEVIADRSHKLSNIVHGIQGKVDMLPCVRSGRPCENGDDRKVQE